MLRTASAVWQGSIKEGKGTVSTQTGTLKETPYSFQSRFESGTGTNPEELIAAAHAGCFSMALSLMLGTAGKTPDRIATKATLTLENKDGGFSITKVHLEVAARVPGMDAAAFKGVAENAKANCPVSKVLRCEITMDAKLEA